MKRLFLLPAAALLAACTAPKDIQESNGDVQLASTAAADTQVVLPKGATKFVSAPTGNTARYRVREQLVGFDLPNDAVGETSAITGTVVFDAAGKVVPGASRITIDAATFKSDRDRRDNYVRRRLLMTEQYPVIMLEAKEAKGLQWPLPASGARTFDLIGALTVRGVTRPTIWRTTATFANGRVTGSTSTFFSFADFGIEKPRVPSVLSVADSIKLEYDFAFTPQK